MMISDLTYQYPHRTSKAAAYLDDLTAACTVKEIKHWWRQLCQLGPKFGYFPEATKSWLIANVNAEAKPNPSSTPCVFHVETT